MKPQRLNASCLIYPDDWRKIVWDLFITAILVASCLLTPAAIAFDWNDLGIVWLSYSMDILFLIDLILSFFTCV